MINSLVEAQVREAVAKDENRNADGTVNWNFVDADCYASGVNNVNWNFVDADCYASGVNKLFKDDAAYYEAWDDVCFDIDLEETLKNMSNTDTQLEMNI